MDVILGFGPAHDRLFAAALRGLGRSAEAAAPPDDGDLALGRRLMPRGHPSAMYYLAGAAARHAGPRPDRRFVVPGDRCGGYASDLARALVDAGVPGAAVLALAPERATSLWRDLELDPGRAAPALAEAVAVGDVLDAAAARARLADVAAERAVDAALADAERALTAGASAEGALRRHAAALSPGAPPRARVRLTGELLATRYDRAVGAGLARWLAARGVAAEAPTLTEWLLYAAWRAASDGAVLASTQRALLDALRRAAETAGVAPPSPIDPAAWADAARRWLPVSLCAGSGFMELATWLAVDRDRDADLVLSLKPFASITSSAASDAVIQTLARGAATPFLALELNGDLQAQLESRLELALQVALWSPP
ncbi:MAG: hypothetical protein U0324_37785 [Polyangiales bacterium]